MLKKRLARIGVDPCCFTRHADWLAVGWALLQQHADYQRDYPMPTTQRLLCRFALSGRCSHPVAHSLFRSRFHFGHLTLEGLFSLVQQQHSGS